MSKPAEWVNPLDSVSTRTAAWFELAMAETPLSTSCCGIPRMVDVHDADRVGLRRVGHALQLLRDERERRLRHRELQQGRGGGTPL